MSTIRKITVEESDYPALLKEIYDPPEVLYVRGALEERVRVAIVGSRTPTKYGISVAEQLSSELAAAGVEIVSGLAYGIDAAAHRAALELGRTLAVLPGSVEDPQPSGNAELAEEIVKAGGALISEHPEGTPVGRWSFPQRNRIVSGISNAVIAVEGTVRSGALITARSALEQNRTVFAVPGPIFSLYSEGPNELIKSGAIPATKAEDILEHLPIDRLSAQTVDNPEQDALVLALNTPKTLNELMKSLNLSAPDLTARLTILEMNNKLYREETGEYVLTKRD